MRRPPHPKVAPAAELMLLLAGTAERRAAMTSRIVALGRDLSPEVMTAEMDRQRSRLVLGERARQLGLTSSQFDAELAEVRQWAAMRAMLFDGLTLQAVTCLEGTGVPALPLKGTSLAASAHGDPSARTSEDIDLLVPERQLGDAVAALAALGYEPDPSDPRSAVHTVLRPADRAAPRLEIHWRVHWYGDRFAARMLAESRLGADGVREAPPAATLIALLLFYAKDGFTGLRLPIDIAGFADRHQGELTPSDVLGYAESDPEIQPAVAAALAVARELVGLDLGLPAPRLSARQERAARLANWPLEGGADQTRATVRLVDALLAPEGTGIRFARNRLRPFRRPWENLLYVVKTGVRWLPALASIRRGRRAHELPRSELGDAPA
jgi:hypothetical protein